MADEQEPSPRNMGNFLLWVGVILVAALAVFPCRVLSHRSQSQLDEEQRAENVSGIDRRRNAIILRQASCIPRKLCPKPFVAACRRTRMVRQNPSHGDEKSRWGLFLETP